MKKLQLGVLIIFCCIIQSCAIKKYMPDDTFLYNAGKVEIHNQDNISDQNYIQQKLDDVLFPTPNTKTLGMRPGLHIHYKAQRENPGFLNRFLNKRIGEKPVYFDEVNIENTIKVLENRLENIGFFNSKVDYEVKTDTIKKQKNILYQVQLNDAYTMNSFQVDAKQLDSIPIFKDIELSLVNSKIDKKSRFDLDLLKEERERIHTYLKEKGYYNFNPNFLVFEIDTNQYQNKKFDLYLRLKNEVPNEALSVYKIKSVDVYPNFNLNSDQNIGTSHRFEKINFFQDTVYFKPKRLSPFILIEEGDIYQPSVSRATSRRLGSLNSYRFINIDYETIDSISQDYTRWLDAKIALSPLKKRSLRFELQAFTKSNNFTGPSLGITYINRNLFKAGEQLRINATTGYEQQFLSGDQDGLRSIQLGLRGTLSFTRLLFPINLNRAFKYAIPKTNISLGVDYLNRSNLYTLNSISTSFGYTWEANRYVTHRINPISVEYLNLSNTSEAFEEILDNNPFLRRSFEQQFIAGLNYSFTYNSISNQQKGQGLFFNFNFDTAGNTLDALVRGSKRPRTFLDLEYAQYAKADIDLRYHYAFNQKGNKLVGRFFAGLGLPYENSSSLPFVKQYFAGGPYSVRGFRIRSLGPGTYQPDSGLTSFFDQAGDIRFEANIEYRFPIFSYLNGAVFSDAGNVWLMNENPALPGGKFTSSFAEEFGVSTGVGLRVDVTGFVIRFDLATSVKRPAQNWHFDYDRPILNFAIGYPF